MKFQLITLSALVFAADPLVQSQTAPVAAPAPSAAAAPSAGVPTPATAASTLPTPTLPSGQPQRQGLAPNQLPNPATQTSNPGGTVQDTAITPADQALLGQLQQTVVARVQGSGSWAPLHFQVQNGVVTVLGAVPSVAQQQQVEAAVQQTPGVVAVINKLTASPAQQAGIAGPQDQALLMRVRQSVVPQIQVAGTPVPVDFSVQQGVVTVTGIVPTIEQKRQISALVQQVPGVIQIRDMMNVPGMAGTVQNLNSRTPATSAGVQIGGAGANSAAGTQTGSTTSPNVTPTGRTNSTALPAGLGTRTDLPPGLNRGTELTPAPRTNSFQ
ncbi:MAG TPA: BON domain-containing protein [Verrucomicrobiae bacterium]|nr:BON domain-containing protein [Verrucomicrobiae bacterium]